MIQIQHIYNRINIENNFIKKKKCNLYLLSFTKFN